MALTKHHDLINTDYFSTIKYIKEIEKELERKLTDKEKQIIEDTFRTLIVVNNEWSNYANKTDDSFAKNKKELETYLKKYENKVSDKFVDLFIVELFKEFESLFDEMNEIERRNLDKKCNSIKARITEILEQLEDVDFDYIDNGYFYYKRNASNKTKRHYKSLLDYVDEVNNFIKTFNTENEYNTIEEDIDSDEVKYIRFMYNKYAELTLILKNENYDKALKRIIYFLKYERPKYLHNKFVGELGRLKTISFLIIDKKYEEAYEETMKFIKKNDKWFVRAS